MTDSEENVISVTILERSYKIKCPPQQASALQAAASYVDEQMHKFKQASSIKSTDRIAIVTALNICHELMQTQQQKNNYIDIMNQRIQDLQRRIENFLAANKEIAV